MREILDFGFRKYPKFDRKCGQNFSYNAKTTLWPQIYSDHYLINEYQELQRESGSSIRFVYTMKQNN